ncbi:trimeric intracellular cation channel family protein [Ascidiimonas sp. W6]|uniref:trimeric intracellular cation channel family protein n=1 Tax=Ascidiimonas meishanensis TaxID=3128903 RepID=UPI0030EE4841
MLFYSLDLIGTLVFAISGALAAMNKRLDLFGIFIIAFVTAVGGGTLRDVLIGRTPVGWMYDLNYIYIILIGFLIAIIFKQKIDYLRKSLFLFDTIGLGVFTLIGIEKGVEAQLHPIICIALGAISASFGGVIRDILCNEIPVIFREEVYATACLIGGLTYFLVQMFPVSENISYIITALVVIIVRLMAVYFKLKLPSIQK